MRVSTAQFHQQSINSVLRQQSATAQTLEQISSGKRVNTAGDDPVASIGIDNLKQENTLIDQYLKNIDYADNKLSVAESTLGSAESLSRTIKDQMLSLTNGRHSDDDIQAIATEMKSNLEALQSLANTRDESGNYIFAGFETEQQPFEFGSGTPRTISYQGDSGVRNSVISSGVLQATNIAGDAAFMNGENAIGDYSVNYQAGQTGEFSISSAKFDASAANPAANYTLAFVDDNSGGVNVNYTDSSGAPQTTAFTNPLVIDGVELKFDGVPAIGDSVAISEQSQVSIFDTIEQAITLAESGELQNPNGQAEMAQILDNMNQGINQIGMARSEAGIGLSNTESYAMRHEEAKLVNTSAQSKLEDLDLASAISEFEKQQLALNAASSLFSRVSSTTLFDFI
ncbi:flagellar hook-associated protein FlgL [Parashewanella spongiae]|uniref:Flagellar hook-associated protein FlgL n=1 Tax=Parashewanella spongiae TaxID=342950 RepID=A0A3A6TYG3_9GAMM|nr:flagellar hook-associated protein FlgL [Parashewanella spongiae]MCL1076616.1 flagellar hook-associated protein FlgL [Parashewanella spongiae]RJY19570.1 flagellar hook-associated protein FlgL [Parashewanella spongiae]